MQYCRRNAGEAGSKEPMLAKPAVEPIVEQLPLFSICHVIVDWRFGHSSQEARRS
jgi:hypothetical protein